MSPSRPVPGSAGNWIARATGDLALARVPLPEGGFYEDLCFHAQQAAEKALKSIYVSRGWAFRYVHDLEALLSDLRDKGLAIPQEVGESVTLTGYAGQARYPGIADPVTEEEYRQAVRLAERVVAWAESMIISGAK